MSNDRLADAQRDAPQRPPMRMRASKGTREVRLGVLGILSAINSPIANSERIATATVDPINARGELCRFNHRRLRAQSSAARAVSERTPATIPILTAKAQT